MTSSAGAGVLRSTPLRLTAVLVLIFTLFSLAGFAAAYRLTRNGLEASLQTQLRQLMASYLLIPDEDDLLERLEADEMTAKPANMIVHYTPDNGTPIGNVGVVPPVRGLQVLAEAALSPIEADSLADSYLAMSARVGRGQLVLALSREQIDEMGEVFLTVFLVGLVPMLALGAGAGLFVASRARDRIEAIRETLGALTSGQLEARVSVDPLDADDLAQISLAVNRMAAAQARQVASLRQISADIAHDLKTPIQRVAVLLDRLAIGSSLSSGQAALVGQALDETDRIVKTFQALLQIAQIEGGQVRDRFVPVDLAEVVKDLVEVYEPAAEESGHRLIARVEDKWHCVVRGDQHLLSQVLANLIENGLRHVPSGGQIEVSLTRKDGSVVLRVQDDGPGIPEEERGNVLRRLYRLERSRTSEGSGLGLSLVAAICGLHDAALRLDDAKPGLLVRIAFPPSPSNLQS
jgi:signal transduction histidine kinase